MLPSIARYSASPGFAARVLAPIGVLLLVCYPLAVYLALVANRPGLAVVLCALSFALLAMATPRRFRLVAIALLGLVAIVGFTAGLATGLSYAPPVVINLGLAAWFGLTLRASREPMISRFARIERGTLPPDLVAYTRRLTLAWTLFFLAMAAVSAALSMLPSPAPWAWFTSFGNWACVAALFFGEHLYRRKRFPHYPHASPMRVIALVRTQWRAPR
jgi:uncharacterized membrane protein